MKRELLRIICCPDCSGPLNVSNARSEDGEIVAGELNCAKCHSVYPIQDGLPILLRGRTHSAITRRAFSSQWTMRAAGRFEYDTLYGQTEAEELLHFRIDLDLADFESLSGRLILDAGCGCGRLTANLGREVPGSTVVGIDFSDGARVAYERARGLPNVHILQCDLMQPPFRPGTFDYVWSEGVLMCTPSTAQGFSSLSNLVRGNGKMYVWVYANDNLFVHPYRLARKILYKPYLLPTPAIYALSWLLAVPLYGFHKVRELLGATRIRHQLRKCVFSFYDTLSPEYMHSHSREEVAQWFASHQYKDIKFVRSGGAVGTKTEDVSERKQSSPAGQRA